MGVCAIIVAAGSGARLGGETPKQFLELGDRPVLAWSVEAFFGHPEVDELVVVVAADRLGPVSEWLPAGVEATAGGATRADSVRAGMAASSGRSGDVLLVHDGARPFVSRELIGRVVAAAADGPVIPAVPVADTIKRVDGAGWIEETLPRDRLRGAQTPQGFPYELLAEAHVAAGSASGITDDALLLERSGRRVRTIEGDLRNFKITTPDDLARARWLVETRALEARP